MRSQSRSVRIVSLILGSVVALLDLPGFSLSAAQSAGVPGEGPPSYTGAGSCSASPCHGSPKAKPYPQFRVTQDEFMTWANKDRHAQAYTVLGSERSKQIAKNLRLEKTAVESARCLDCHALNVAREKQGRTFSISDGVSCEECHGPASAWLGKHTEKEWTHEQSLAAGMVDLRSPAGRARKCLTCHQGTASKVVDHELIAAGHPDLYFELDSFSLSMPAHWNSKAKLEKDPWLGVRTWMVGQAVSVRESMKLLQAKASGAAASWPEFADYDCFACHHDLTKESKDSWRQAHGWDWKAGQPRRNGSRHAVLKAVLQELAPNEAAAIETDLQSLDGLMVSGARDKDKISQTAGRIAAAMEPLIKSLSGAEAPASADGARRLLRAITAEADRLSYAGYRVAVQTYLAVESLYAPLGKNAKPGNDVQIKTQIGRLATDLVDYECRKAESRRLGKGEKPAAGPGCPDTKSDGGSCFNPGAFAAHLKELEKLLPS